jgi:hypothetical protein
MIEPARVVRHPLLPRELAFLGSIEIPSLLDQATGETTGIQLLQHWEIGPWDTRLQVFRWLIQHKLLISI